MASINGTLGNDNLTGTLESDFIFGDLGDDTLDAGGGNDELGAMRFCEVLKIRVLNHLFRAAIAAK